MHHYFFDNTVKEEYIKEVEKVWGSEIHIVKNIDYTLKKMVILPGVKVSTHFHKDKKESFCILEGELILELTNLQTGDKEVVKLQDPLDTLTIPENTPHCFYIPKQQKSPSVFLEVSTFDSPSDNFRFSKSRKIDD